MIVSHLRNTTNVSSIPPSEDEDLQKLKSEIMFLCNQRKHDCLMTPAEKYGELLRDHFKYYLEKVKEHQFQMAVAEALEEAEEAEGAVGQQATLSRVKKLVKEKLTTIIEEIEEEERQAELERKREQKQNQEQEQDREFEMSRMHHQRQRSTTKNLKNSITLSPAPRKWKDTRRVEKPLPRDNTERSTFRASNSVKKKKESGTKVVKNVSGYINTVANLMNRYNPAPKPKQAKKKNKKKVNRKKPYIPGESNQMTYKQGQTSSNLILPKNRKQSGNRKKRNSVANSRMSYESDGFSNSRMLRIFVKEAVKERHGTDELDAAIMNRSLSQSSMRIFNELRHKERERNSPNKILDKVSGKVKSIGLGSQHNHGGSRESTLSGRRKRSNLIYEIEDRSLKIGRAHV